MTSTVNGQVQIRTNGHLDGPDIHSARPPTTTISTIAVQSGNTRIVIALLQSKEWIQLKIQEMQPSMTDIGQNLEEVVQLHQQHEKVLEKLQTKQSPVEELLKQADELIANQKPRGEVYSAMAENLGLAWKDLNAELEQRRQILEQAVAFFTRSKDFADTLERIQKNLTDVFLPDSAELCTTMLQRHQEERKVALSCSMYTLKEGQQLLERLCEVATHSMGDSRPFHMQHAARQTSTFVERYMEALHDQWRHLEAIWTQRKLKLEQCLKRCYFLKELIQVQNWLSMKGGEYISQQNLGDSLASAEILQHEHSKVEKDSKVMQDQSLKLVKSAEQLALSGNYAGEECKVAAYGVLSECSELLNMLETRSLLLSITITFFTSAQTALNKLDQIEIQLTTNEAISTASFQANLNSAIEGVASPAIEEGRMLIDKVGSNQPGVQGVARKVAELEQRRMYLLELNNARQAENLEQTAVFRNFNTNYDLLISWIKTNGFDFVERFQDMGSTQASAKAFCDQHETLQSDLRYKGIEVEALLSTVPALVRAGGKDAEDVLRKSENLREQWNLLRDLLEKRLLLGQSYLSFHKLASKVTNEINDLEFDVRRVSEASPETNIRNIEEKFLTLQQGILQLKNSGRNFLEDTQKVEKLYLNMASPRSYVQGTLDGIESRKITLTTQWTTWQSKITSTKEAMIQWEHLVKDSHRVIKCANELESKMFPVIPNELKRVDSILPFLENRMMVLLPQIKSVQQEMDKFLKKSDVLCPKDKPQPEGQKVVDELQHMNQNFQKKLTDYQILISMMTSYFKNFEELEKMVDLQETQFKMASLSNDVGKTDMLIQEHEMCKSAVTELFKFTNKEAEQVILKINEAEPPHAARQDREKITSIYVNRKEKFELSWEEHKKILEQHLQMSSFNKDMQQINRQIEELNSQLLTMKQNYGDSLPSTIATSQAFIQFEKTVETLQLKIQHFVSTAERMIKEQNVDTDHVFREIQTMQSKWSTFRTEVTNNRRLIDLSIEYFKLVQESEEWLKEGSRMLISIARRSSSCKTTSDARSLNQEIQHFLDKGQLEQDERFSKLSSLSMQLYGIMPHPSMEHVTNRKSDMLNSFTVIKSEITVLTENIQRAEVQKTKETCEKEELDAALQAAKAAALKQAQVEAEAAKAAALKQAQAEAEAAKAAALKQAHTEAEAAKAAALKQAQAEAAAAKAAALKQAQAEAEAAKAAALKLAQAEAKAAASLVQKAEEKRFEIPPSIAPRFVIPLTDAEVSEGSRFVFECKVEGHPKPQLQWFKDGIPAETNPDYQTKYINGICTLTIEETFSEDTARFTCKATNLAGVAETHGQLIVKESRSADALIPPHFIKEPIDCTVMEGKHHQLECEVSGNPLPLVSWFKDDLCIDNSTDFSVMYNNGYCTLSMDDTCLEHTGRYTCRALNQIGQVACSVNIIVESSVPAERPVFVVPLSNVMARAGQKLRLECSVTGQPVPEILWLHNSKAIKETRDIRMQFDCQKPTLVITEAFPKDAGAYTVIAKNKAGEAISTCNVSVKGRLPLETSDSEMASDIEPAKPMVRQNLLNQTVTEGNKVRMDCIIVGQPEPEVIWYHNGKPVKESDDFQLLFEGDCCTLIIKVAYLEDAGTYRCVAINSGGEASSQCALTVQPGIVSETKSEIVHKEIVVSVEKPISPKFIRLLKNTTTTEGEPTKLECQVIGPDVIIKWFKDGQEISTGKDYHIQEDQTGTTSLRILKTQSANQGSFTVSAQNKGGESKCFCSLNVVFPCPVAAPIVLNEPPVFLKHLAELRIPNREPAKFEAIVVGTPPPKVAWNYQGKPLVNSKDYQISEDGNRRMLTVMNTNKENSGRYSLVAENVSGVATSSAILHAMEPAKPAMTESYQEQIAQSTIMTKKTVVEKCTIDTMPEIPEPEAIETRQPDVITSQTSITLIEKPTVEKKVSVPPRFSKPVPTALINEGEKLFLEGHIEGSPQPECKWLKDNIELQTKTNLIICYGSGKSSLTIPKAKESDSGLYSCIATNIAGRATSTAEVLVKVPRIAPRFEKTLDGGMVKSGARVNMEVEVIGVPKPDVKWYRNGMVIQHTPDFRISCDGNHHRLLIHEVFPDDSGTYMVIASNMAGEAKCIADLIVEEERSPIEEKMITYQEISSIQQKREMFTKISMSKAGNVETPPVAAEVRPPTEISQVLEPKSPSPPLIPAVVSRLWSHEKPEACIPTIDEAIVVQEVQENNVIEAKLEEPKIPGFIPEQQEEDSRMTIIYTASPALPSRSESFVKQTAMKFSEQSLPVVKTKSLEKKPVASPVQNGIKQDFGFKSTSISSMQKTVSETKSQTMSTMFTEKSNGIALTKETTVKPFIGDKKEMSTFWNARSTIPPETQPSWRPVQPFTGPPTLASADIVQYQDIAITPVLETKVLSTSPAANTTNFSSSTTAVHQSKTIISKKYETTTEVKQQFIETKDVIDTFPKPIIKKDTPSEGPKVKKEVVIEEEPVISAEVKPPIFSKVRGIESFWKIA